MNRIILTDDKIEEINIDDSIHVKLMPQDELIDITTLKITVLKDSFLEIDYNIKKETKLKVIFNILANANFTCLERKTGQKIKTQYQYDLASFASLNAYKFYDTLGIKEYTTINLNGNDALANVVLKSLAKEEEKYEQFINHKAIHTTSNVINNIVNFASGKTKLSVALDILNDVKDAVANQDNQIITFNDNECVIKPILLIDEEDVMASHSAYIGNFSKDEIFYLESRGIPYKQAINLLIKGFMLKKFLNQTTIEDEIKAIVDEYWR